MPCEIIVKIKDHSKSLTHKTRVYNTVTAEFDDPKIDDLVAKITKEFASSEPVKISVNIKLIDE